MGPPVTVSCLGDETDISAEDVAQVQCRAGTPTSTLGLERGSRLATALN
ncbi:MAG: hypothetical protein R3E89_03200 [Thiolinea sp.]